MSEHTIPEYRIGVDQLRMGVFVRLEKTDWFSHPFLYSSFLINDAQQIEALRLLGITEVICIPEKSKVLPAQPGERGELPTLAEDTVDAMERMWRVKKERVARLLEKRRRIALCEEQYIDSMRDLRGVTRAMLAGQEEAVDDARLFVRRLVKFFLGDIESVLHLMNVVPPTEQVYSHALNVTILSLMLGREVGLGEQEMENLGMGALFHDIGKERIEKKLLKKQAPLNKAERKAIELHVEYGVELMAKHKQLSRESLTVIVQHHECLDGKGYPGGLVGEEVERLPRITVIANVYDNLCNHSDPNLRQTPYLALSQMFAQKKNCYDNEMLSMFIRCLGVYPPGTVVQLNNGSIGMVMSVNPENQLCPSLVLYDSEVSKREALVIDLAEEPGLKVEKSIRLSHLPQEILDYLSPRTKITYYVDPDA